MQQPTITMSQVDALVPYARNARQHSEAQIAQIAASIREFGWTNPILTDGERGVIAGHGRLAAARKLGITQVPTIELAHLSKAQRRALVLADNKLALSASWDDSLLAAEFEELELEGYDLAFTGFAEEEVRALRNTGTQGLTDPDEVPEVPDEPVTKLGDVWLLGNHRVMCGDSTNVSDVEKLMAGTSAQLLHADPPYGMGKESDGVANDNIYGVELDQFQMEWWATFRTFLADNASAYIWGNALDLWRLWYRGGLCDSEKLELQNQIVWDKKNIQGMKSDLMTQYPTTTEHCLFFQIGNQYRGNINIDDFPESWEPTRRYMEAEATAAGIKPADIKRACGCSMYSHWFTRAQFTLIPEKHYCVLAAAYPGRFSRPWNELKRDWDAVKSGPTILVQRSRSYFDNAHESMSDVWEFPRVSGDERHGHATPKPVAMMERIMKSSLPKGGICVEPFGGSGSTLLAAEKTGRICYTMELQAKYVDVIVRRWKNFTGNKARLENGNS